MDLFKTDLAACLPWDITSCFQGIVRFIPICISHSIQHPMMLADNFSLFCCCLLKLALLQQNHIMHIFSWDCSVWVALLCQQRGAVSLAVVFSLGNFYYILQPLTAVPNNSTNSRDCGKRKLHPVLTRPLSVCTCVCSFVLDACVAACVQRSQVGDHIESQFHSHSSSSLDTLITVWLTRKTWTDTLRWHCLISITGHPCPTPHTSSLPCLSFPLSQPPSPSSSFLSPRLSSAFGWALTWLSLWVCLLFFTSPDQRGELESI